MQAKFLFIDFHKAFDSISYSYLWKALKKQRINGKYIRIINNLYQGIRARVKIDKTGESFYRTWCETMGSSLTKFVQLYFRRDI